jgi:DNA-binding MarR family transcriptional regulator
MMKAMRALARYAAAGIEETALGLSDFRVLEALLHKGPLAVNTIVPIVDLPPGSISIAVDRLVEKASSAGSRAPETAACGSSPSLHRARPSLIQLFESIPGR